MRIHTSILFLLVTSSVLAALHILALEFYLYWQYPWFDLPMHFLGGAVVALSLFAMTAFGIPIPSAFRRLVPVLAFVLFVGIAWEVWEVLADISTREQNYLFDTAVDLVMDLSGGFLGYIIGSRLHLLD